MSFLSLTLPPAATIIFHSPAYLFYFLHTYVLFKRVFSIAGRALKLSVSFGTYHSGSLFLTRSCKFLNFVRAAVAEALRAQFNFASQVPSF